MKFVGEHSSNGGCTLGDASFVTEQLPNGSSNLAMTSQEDRSTKCLETSSEDAINDRDGGAMVKDKQPMSSLAQASIGEESQLFSSNGMKATNIPDSIIRDGDSQLFLDLSLPPGNFCLLRLFKHC